MATADTTLTTLSTDITAIARQASQSTVALQERGRSFSGFHWRADVVATASELVEARRGDKIIVVTPSTQTTEGTVIGRDPSTDIALIRVPESAAAIAPSTRAGISPGEAVIAAGRSLHGPTCAVGFVALAGGPWRSMRGGEIDARIRLDITLPAASEGGAVLDAAGTFIGMAVFGPRRRVLVIPAATIDRVGEELLAHGRIRRGYLGVGIQRVGVQAADAASERTGLMIISLDPNGPAAKARMQQGDIILAFGEHAVGSPRAMAGMLRTARIGERADLDILRSGQNMKVSVEIGESPSA
jgi:S1-C subfamily serine protease